MYYPFSSFEDLGQALTEGSEERELLVDQVVFDHGAPRESTVPPGASELRDGEWVLATVSVGASSLAVAGRIEDHAGARRVTFTVRDWLHLECFAAEESNCPCAALTTSANALGAEEDWDDAQSEIRRITRGRSKAESELPPSQRGASFARPLHVQLATALVVDDDPALRCVLGSILEAAGVKAEGFDNGEDAIEAVLSGATRPDLVILDWNLPGMNGIEVCRRLRSDRRTAELPIVFLTSHGTQSDLELAFAAGADDFVVKPFRAPELRARVISLLRRAPKSSPGPLSQAV